ncbi:MAG: Uma2 family endonuclease [Okeania sp. SIO3H1]|nr:Uma2 family endonuclease [Okeania sp. SIO3H1]
MVTTNLVQTIAVNIPKEINLKITHEQFVELALVNRDLQLERTAKGELIVMVPTGSGTGNNK